MPYNPAADFPAGVDYTLVTPSGFRYEYDATAGLQAMVSPEGRRLVWSDSGIVASSGDRVSFQKDPAGRISIVTLPDGQQIFYDYDAEGHLVRVLRGADAVRTDLGYTATSPRLLDQVIRTDQVGQQVRYAPDGALLAVDVVSRYLGGSRQFLGQTITGTLPAQSVDRSAFVMTSAELNQTATGQLTLGIAVHGTNGFQPAAASVSGAMTALSRVAAGMSISLVTLPVAGIHTLAVLGVDANTAGNYEATIYLPGDVNQDGAVDGLDRTRFEQALGSVQGQPQYLQSADADRDGDVDLNDAVWLDQNFGFVANRAPQVASHTVRTHVDVPVVVELGGLATDPDGQSLVTLVASPEHGRLQMRPDGQAVEFTPAPGFSGQARFEVRASDGAALSLPSTITVDVSSAPVVAIHLSQSELRLDSGQTMQLGATVDFADESGVTVPVSYFTYVSGAPPTLLATDFGQLRAVADGTTHLQVTRDGVSAFAAVSVGLPDDMGQLATMLMGFDVFPTSVALTPGASRQLSVTLLDDIDLTPGTKGTLYFSRAPQIVSVDRAGQGDGTGQWRGQSVRHQQRFVGRAAGTNCCGAVGTDGGGQRGSRCPRCPRISSAGTTRCVRR